MNLIDIETHQRTNNNNGFSPTIRVSEKLSENSKLHSLNCFFISGSITVFLQELHFHICVRIEVIVKGN